MAPVTHPVYLVRHGESEWNVLRVTQGQIGHPRLTARGREQAAAAATLIAADLAGRPVDRIVTSDLVRAVETAQILAHRFGTAPVCDARLREQHLGRLEGRPYEESFAAAEAIDWSDPTLPIAGGESLMEVYERLGAVLDEVDPDEVTILVSHGDSIRSALAYLSGIRPNEADWVVVDNGAVVRIDGQVTWLGR